MIKLHPRILGKEGKKDFAVLPFEEFERLTGELSAYEDLRDLRSAKAQEERAASSSLGDVRKELNI